MENLYRLYADKISIKGTKPFYQSQKFLNL